MQRSCLKHSDEDEDEDELLSDNERLQQSDSFITAKSILSLMSHNMTLTALTRLMNRLDSQSFPTIVLPVEAMQDGVILEV